MLNKKKTISKILNWIKSNKRYCVEKNSSNGWTYWKYSDGTFEARRYSTAGSTGTLTQIGSSGTYYSAASQITFPSIGQTGIRDCSVTIAPTGNFIMGYFLNRLTTTGVYMGYIRWGSGTSVSDIVWTMRITGTYS